MAKYMLLYVGPATPMEEMTPEQMQEIGMAWKNWIDSVGPKLVDVGLPTANGQAVVDDGSKGTATSLNGYSIVEADSIDEAKKLVEGHPFLSDATGKFQVEVFELLPMPSM